MSSFKDRTTDRPREGRQLKRSIASMYSDDPVAAGDDVLNRQRVAAQLARAVNDLSGQTESAVVSLVGPWGSGKTSLLKQIQGELASSGWYIGVHNPWSYSDYVGAVAGFFSTLRDAVPNEVLGREWREAVSGWVSRVAPFGVVGGVVGVDASGPIGAAGALLAGDRSPEQLRKNAAEGLGALQHPVLMVLDDLDRLSPDELLFTFKLVRLLGRLPNVYYLLAYDEETLTDVLESTELVGRGDGRAQRYLEKMIQVRLEVPPLLPEQQASLANASIDEICRRHHITLSADDNRRLQRAWQACLSVYLDQPRSVKRLFTQVDAMWPDVDGEVDFVDFVLITFLRTFERRTLDLVVTHRDDVLQSAWGLGRREDPPQARWQRWTELIAAVQPRHPSEIASLLAELFLHLRGARDNTTYDGSYHEDIKRRLGVGSSEHFDRYIQIGVPESDLSQSVVRQAVAELRSSTSGPGLSQIIQYTETNASTVIRKLTREHEDEPIPAGSLLPLLGDLYFPAMDQKGGIFSSSPDFGVLLLAVKVLDSAPDDHVVPLLEDLATENNSSLALATDAVRKAAQNSDKQHPWVEGATDPVTSALETALRDFATVPASATERLAHFLRTHCFLTDTSRTREFVWELIDIGVWQLDELLGLLIPLGQASNGEETWTSMGDFSEGTYDDLLGIDTLLERLPARPELRAGSSNNDYPERRVDPGDHTARIDYALASLERVRAERMASEAAPSEDLGDDAEGHSVPRGGGKS